MKKRRDDILLFGMALSILIIAPSTSYAALIFHSGFETGDFAEWLSTGGSPTVQSTIKKTGTYAMRCNPSAASDYATKTFPGATSSYLSTSFYLYIASAPSADAVIARLGVYYIFSSYTHRNINLQLTSDRKLKANVSVGSTVLALDTWYRIGFEAWVDGSGNTKTSAWINGNPELTNVAGIWAASTTNQSISLGIYDSNAANLYFDDYVLSGSSAAIGDLGDIRVVLSLPNADGTNQDFGQDEAGTTRPFYDSVDELTSDAAVDTGYVWYNDGVQGADSEETFALQNSATIGLAAGDTIEAVNLLLRMKRSTGAGSTHQIVEYDTANTETTQALTTGYVNYQKYRATPPTSASWTQAVFDAYEVGAGNANDGGQDTFISCVNVMVAYKVVGGTPYTETINNTVGITDARSVSIGIVRTISDSLGITDAQVLVREVVRSFDESLGVTDARDKVSVALRTLAEALGITDEQIASQGYIRVLSESLGLTDAWTDAELKVIADALGMTDEALRTFIILRTLEESLALTDSTSASYGSIRTVADSLGLTDAMTGVKDQERTLSDALGITDDAVRLYVGLRTIDDALGLTDEQTKVSVMVRVIADSLGLTDTRTVLQVLVRTFSDDLGLTDSATGSQGWNRTLDNDLGLTDSSSEEEGKVIADSLGLTDDMIRLSVLLRTITDDLGITDVMEYQFSGGIIRTINDSLGLTDARVLVRTVVRSFDDPMGVTDSQTKVSETLRTLADSLGLTDAQVTSIGIGRTVDDSLGLTDAQTPIQVIVRTFDDPLGLTDERILTATIVRAFDDSLGLTDAASSVAVFSRSIADSEGLTDVVSESLVAAAGLYSLPQATSIPPFVTIFMRTVLDDPNAAAARVTLGAIYWSSVPASATAEGTPGEIAYDSGYFYICIAVDTWKRVQIITWP